MHKQSGMTLISMMLLAGLVGMIGYGILQLVPVYLNQMKVKSILNGLESEFVGQEVSPMQVMNAIDKRLNIEMVSVPARQDFKVTKTDHGLRVQVDYTREVPYLGNLSIVAAFDDAVEITR